MSQATIFGPFFACVALTLVVWVYMYVRRIHFLVSHNIDSKEMAVPGALAAITPPAVSDPSEVRFGLYLVASIAVWFIAIRAALVHFAV